MPPTSDAGPEDQQDARLEMVDVQVRARGVRDARVLAALERVPRDVFVDRSMRHHAYSDMPLPIDCGQTISQPYIVGLMAEAAQIKSHEHVLEVGTGSGYGAAVLGCLAARVDTLERIPELASQAARRLERLGFKTVHVALGDGNAGLLAHAPYHAIVVTAAASQVPPALVAQLAPGGRLIMPLGDVSGDQELVRLVRGTDHTITQENLGGVRFVPLLPGVLGM